MADAITRRAMVNDLLDALVTAETNDRMGRDGRPLVGTKDVARQLGITPGSVTRSPRLRAIMITLSRRVRRWDPADLDDLVAASKGNDGVGP